MEFSFKPYVGALPLTFGMKPSEVQNLIGPPYRSTEEDREIKEFRWSDEAPNMPVNILYSPEKEVVEIEFAEGSSLLYNGMSLMEIKGLGDVLSAEYVPRRLGDILVFMDIGMALGGFEKLERDRSIVVFARGHWDRFKEADE